MSRYRRKSMIVDAFRWTGGPGQADDPPWLVEALGKERGTVGSVWFERGAPDEGTTLSVETPNGTEINIPGDFVAREPGGEIHGWAPDVFEETFEPVEDEPPAAPEAVIGPVEITRIGDRVPDGHGGHRAVIFRADGWNERALLVDPGQGAAVAGFVAEHGGRVEIAIRPVGAPPAPSGNGGPYAIGRADGLAEGRVAERAAIVRHLRLMAEVSPRAGLAAGQDRLIAALVSELARQIDAGDHVAPKPLGSC